MKPTISEQEAQRLGFPRALFGYTPNETAYWFEPGLPWLVAEHLLTEHLPLDYRGNRTLLCVAYLNGDQMAPRFPHGCGVQTAPVYEKQQLVVGRVYTYRFRSEEAGEWEYVIGRLVQINRNHLVVQADNRPAPSIWLLEDDEQQATWNVREVTHYVSYPEL